MAAASLVSGEGALALSVGSTGARETMIGESGIFGPLSKAMVHTTIFFEPSTVEVTQDHCGSKGGLEVVKNSVAN